MITTSKVVQGGCNIQLCATGSLTPKDDNTKDKVDNVNQKTPQIQSQHHNSLT